MQEYQFPMDRISNAGLWTVVIHVVLLAIAIAPFLLLLFQKKRRARGSDGYLLIAGIVAAPPISVGLAVDLPGIFGPFVFGYMAFFEFACITALVVTYMRLATQKESTSILAFLGLLVVLAVAVGLLLPAVPSAKEAARRMQCSNNLKQLSLGLLNYESSYGKFPAAFGSNDSGIEVSWRIQILPFSEGIQLYEQYDPSKVWDSEKNSPLALQQPSLYSCPSRPKHQNESGQYYTSYAVVVGDNTPFSRDSPTSIGSMSAGTSNLIGLVEACGAEIVWTEPKDMTLSNKTLGINLPGDKPHTSRAIASSYHTGGTNVSMVDGSVQFLSEKVDSKILAALLDKTSPSTEVPQ